MVTMSLKKMFLGVHTLLTAGKLQISELMFKGENSTLRCEFAHSRIMLAMGSDS